MIFKEDPEKDITVDNLSQADVRQKRSRSSASSVASASSQRKNGGSADPAVSASTSTGPGAGLIASASSQQKSGGSAGPAVSASSERVSGGSAGPAVSAYTEAGAIPVAGAAAGPATGSQSSAIPITSAAAGQRASPVASASSQQKSGGSASQVAGAYIEAGAIPAAGPVASASSGQVSGGSASPVASTSQVASTKSSTSSSTSSQRVSGGSASPVASTKSSTSSSTSSQRVSGGSASPLVSAAASARTSARTAETRSSVMEFEGGHGVKLLSSGNMFFESPKRRQSNDSNRSFGSLVIRTDRRETLFDDPDPKSVPKPLPPRPSPQPLHPGNNNITIRKIDEISSEFSNTDVNADEIFSPAKNLFSNLLEQNDTSPNDNRYSLPLTRPPLAGYSIKPAQAPHILSTIPEVILKSPQKVSVLGIRSKTNIKFKNKPRNPFFVQGQCLPFKNTGFLDENNLNKIFKNDKVKNLIIDYNKNHTQKYGQIDVKNYNYMNKCYALKKLYTDYKDKFEEIVNQIKFTTNS
jgi:hypothetical protein